jgi:flagellar protein FlaJ
LKAIPFAVISSGILAGTFLVPEVRAIFVSSVSSLQGMIDNLLPFKRIWSLLDYLVPIIVAVCLSFVSVFPMIEYSRTVGINIKAEESMPSFLRDISENRKTGMSPEKSITQAATRKGYGSFTKILKRIVNQIEWGVSLRKIYMDLRDHLRSWPVLMNFLILIETIEVGGGSSEALDLLAAYSERIRDIEKNKREMLKPYIVLPFIWTVLMALTFTFTFYVVTHLPIIHVSGPAFPTIESQLAIFSSAIIFHSWLSGFFTGKVTHGSFAAGFKYSILLVVTALLSLILSQNVIDLIMGLL